MFRIIPKYYVIDHHSMWGWPKTDTKIEDAEVVFVWNDFSIENDVRDWQQQGKKVICFEHGWNAFFDYEINNRNYIADGYIALGKNSANSLIRHGLNQKKVLVTGNPHFDNIKSKTIKQNQKPKVLYTALHWTRDMSQFNNEKLEKIIDTFSKDAQIYVKTNSKSKIDIPKGIEQWNSEINENTNLFEDIRSRLNEFDIILTPKESTFDFIALNMGKKVFRIGKAEEYRIDGDPITRSILPYMEISTSLLNKDSSIIVNFSDELSRSVNLIKILQWTRKLQ